MSPDDEIKGSVRTSEPNTKSSSTSQLLPADAPVPQPSIQTPPGVALSSGICPSISGLITYNTAGMSAGADGSLWLISQENNGQFTIQIYNFSTAENNNIYQSKSHLTCISAVSYDLAYIIGTDTTTWIASVDGAGNLTTLNSLPSGTTPAQISAAPDGTLWALDGNGSAWSYADGAWSLNSSAGGSDLSFSLVSAGSAEFVVGIGGPDGGSAQPMSWSSTGGWQALTSIDAQATWISACSDGATWYVSGTDLIVVPSAGTQQAMDISWLEVPMFWTASCQMIAYVASGVLPFDVYPFAYGILDMEAVSWPAMTTDQQNAYAYISDQLSITASGGIRSQYINTLEPFSSWQVDINNMTKPSDITGSDWSVVVKQLQTELTYVISTNNLFGQLTTLNGFLATIQSDELQGVAAAVGLSEAQQGPTEVEVLLSTLASTVLTRIGSIVPAPYGLVVSLIGSALNAAATYTEQTVSPTAPSGALQVAYSQLATTMGNNVSQTLVQLGDQQIEILQDWGKLSAAGQAISQGIWSWPPNFTGESLANLAPAWDIYFYMALMPAAWQILQGSIIYTVSPPYAAPPNAAPYTMLTKSETDGSGDDYVYYYICCGAGSMAEVSQNNGPYPSTTLMQNIFNLYTPQSDFFGNENGWNLPVVQSPGWVAPPASIPWNEYDPSTS